MTMYAVALAASYIQLVYSGAINLLVSFKVQYGILELDTNFDCRESHERHVGSTHDRARSCALAKKVHRLPHSLAEQRAKQT